MADFRTSKRVETQVSSITVDAGLPVGDHIFQLTAIDKSGNISKPALITVKIIDLSIPIDPVTPEPVVLEDSAIIEPVRQRRVNNSESLSDNTAKKPGTRKKLVKKNNTENKTQSKASSKKPKPQKKSKTDST
jgi:hypothetical protein